MGIRNNARSLLHRFPPLFHSTTAIADSIHYLRCSTRGYFSQRGEDLFLLNYFDGLHAGKYIDIGANHPFRLSNTYLLYKRGWEGITVEPISYLSGLHLLWRERDIHLNAAAGEASGKIVFYELIPNGLSTCDEVRANSLIRKGVILRKRTAVRVLTLADIYTDHLSGCAVDLLSIDSEGLDLEVLKGNDWSKMRPKIIICESENCPDNRIECFLAGKNYVLLTTIGFNKIFERQD